MMRSVYLLLFLLVSFLSAACGSGSSIGEIHGAPEMFSYETVWAFSPTDVWIGGSPAMTLEQSTALVHFDGDEWSTTEVSPYHIASLWGFAPDDLWAVGNEYVLRFDGSSWQETSLNELGGNDLLDIWGSSPQDLWAVGESGVFHYDGTSWMRQSNYGANAIWGADPDAIWTISTFAFRHYDGTSWSEFELDLFGGDGKIWGFGAGEVFIAANDDSIAHWDGSSWSELSDDATFGDLNSVWGVAPDDLWFAGDFGEIVHYNGSTFREIDRQALGSPYLKQYHDIHGSSADDVWIVGGVLGAEGNYGVIYHAGN
ncbi:MAG: hypothetical protein KAI66_22425 [Lentisphaeria bacterium]|nr:hypothetical protein [Lentisphaeria bacterium]